MELQVSRKAKNSIMRTCLHCIYPPSQVYLLEVKSLSKQMRSYESLANPNLHWIQLVCSQLQKMGGAIHYLSWLAALSQV
jgi:hypothetical protein